MTDFSIRDLLCSAVRSDASDIHLSVGKKPTLRIDGRLVYAQGTEPLSAENLLGAMSEFLTPEQLKRYEEDREYDFSFSIPMEENGQQRFRANLFHEMGTPAAALRAIYTKVRTIRQLALPEELNLIAKKDRGLFIVTGPTGSGKSTTLAALIHEINVSRPLHIVTIEDPIEYLYESKAALIRQREVGRDTKSFANALRSAMRQDPDVIMIGELRDLETIASAITAAETGHLVLATLHTRDAAQSVDRIVDVFPPYQQRQICVQLSLILVGVLSQQLIPINGSRGRVAATEYLVATDAVRNYIREGKSAQINNVIQTGSALGMHTMDQDLARLCMSGVVTRDVAAAHAYDIDSFNRYMAC